MIERAKIENVLFKIGVPTNMNGFVYIADAVECIEEHGTGMRVTKELYPHIAQRRSTTAPNVERNIRHAFEVARNKGDHVLVEKYIGLTYCTNSPSLITLHKKIKQECEMAASGDPMGILGNIGSVLSATQFREILHDELNEFFRKLEDGRE